MKGLFGADNPNWRNGATKAKCLDCGKEISKYHKRCRSCARKGELHPNYKGGPPKCMDCGKEIIRGNKRCRECWFKYNQGENNGNYRGGAKYCVDCGCELPCTKPSSITNRCRSCHYQHAQRENHPRWNGGITIVEKSLRGSKYNLKWSMAVRERDGFKCRTCGENTKRVEAHHAVPFAYYINILKKRNKEVDNEMLIKLCKKYKPLWDINNGVTLCRKCHMMVHKGTVSCPVNI
jgi:hypothetical protein